MNRIGWGVASIGLCSICLASATPEIIAYSGQNAGLGGGEVFAGNTVNFFAPATNASGQVIFFSYFATGGSVTTSNNQAAFFYENGTRTLLMRGGASAAGLGGGITYISPLSFPRINDGGEVAFDAWLSDPNIPLGQAASATYYGLPGSQQPVQRTQTAAPGTDANFAWPNGVLAGLANDGTVFFVSDLEGGTTTTADDRGGWIYRNGSTDLLFREGRPAPGTSANFGTFSQYFVRDDGNVYLRSNLSNGKSGLFGGKVGSFAPVAVEGAAVPGQPGVNFVTVDRIVANNVGHVAFNALVSGTGIDASNDIALWAGPAGSAQPVINWDSSAPQIAGATIQSIGTVDIDDTGRFALSATLAGAGVNGNNNVAYYTGTPSNLTLVARTGDALAGAAPGEFAVSLTNLTMNDSGQIAFYAYLFDGNAADQALYAYDPTGGLQLLVRAGDEITLAPGDTRTLLGFAANRSSATTVRSSSPPTFTRGSGSASRRSFGTASSRNPARSRVSAQACCSCAGGVGCRSVHRQRAFVVAFLG